MAPFHAVYYRDARGGEPVREFIAGLGPERQAALHNQVDRLNLLSDGLPHLPFPHTSQVEGELRELRCHYGSELYRVLYRRSKRFLVLLHAFRKTTGKIPGRDIAVAQKRWDDFKRRMDETPRRPPRAIGHDAP